VADRIFFLFCATCVALALLSGCTSPSDNPTTPPAAMSLAVEAQPSVIPANGASRMVVYVAMLTGDEPVADSTQVILLHSLGTLGRGVIYTSGGVALDTLTADTVAGTGWLIACAQGLRDSVPIVFTPLP
jgi:hypothetical protein